MNTPDNIEPRLNEQLIHTALQYRALGYKPIPVHPGTKAAAVKWKKFQTEMPTEQDLEVWFRSGTPNVALVGGSGLVVIDVDDPTFLEAVLKEFGHTPMRCATPTPGHTHLYYGMREGVVYGNGIRVGGRPIDVRGSGSCIMAPWSKNAEGVPYRWLGPVLPVGELPLLNVSWLRERNQNRVMKPIDVSGDLDVMIRRARAYIAHIEGSVAGAGGHKQAMRVAGVLCQKYGLSLEQAFPLFQEWSETSCEPPWSEKEIVHKLSDAIRLRASKGLRPIK